MRDSSRTPVVSAAVGALVLAGVVAFTVGLEERDSDAAPAGVPGTGQVDQVGHQVGQQVGQQVR